MMSEVLGDIISHVDAGCFCAEDGDLVGVCVEKAQWRWRQRDSDSLIILGGDMGDG